MLEHALLQRLGPAQTITWKSPLRDDAYAEYRDGGFLQRLGLGALTPRLAAFWPSRGPQWDALGLSDRGDVLLVEAKAHIAELCSPPSQARPASRQKIEAALGDAAKFVGARHPERWSTQFYQLTNRLAHLHFLRREGVPAWLVLVNFIGDAEMEGPSSAAEWEAAYQVVFHVLGVPDRHKLSRYMIELYPDVRDLV